MQASKLEFKYLILADLVYQLSHKGKPYTSEHWYLTDAFYPLPTHLKLQAFDELIAEELISKMPAREVYPDNRGNFFVLILPDFQPLEKLSL